MTALRHMALGCCILSAVAGMIRTFWPENEFKPVINTVLVVYIIAVGVQMLRTADLQSLGDALLDASENSAQSVPDYSDYERALADTVSAEAVQEVLENSGIEAAVSLQNGICEVTLVHESDRETAEALLAANCGRLPYRLNGGDTP